MTEFIWRGVRERVAALTSAGTSHKVSDFSGHRFVLHPVLPAAEVLDLEQFAGIRLPEEYRTFLLEVGNGGAGPGGGIERVERTADGWQWAGDGVTTVDRLGVPFRPFDPHVYADHWANPPRESDYADYESYWQANRAWAQRLDDLYDEETFGTIALSHQGCGYYWLLVVSGPARGTVWDDARAADVPLSPVTGPAGEKLTFGPWYLQWLSGVEASIASASG